MEVEVEVEVEVVEVEVEVEVEHLGGVRIVDHQASSESCLHTLGGDHLHLGEEGEEEEEQ